MIDIDFGMASVAGITVICYLGGLVFRALPRCDNKFIPIVCGVIGLVLGLVGLYCSEVTDFPADDPISAAAVGIVSGLAATGVNQMVKRFRD